MKRFPFLILAGTVVVLSGCEVRNSVSVTNETGSSLADVRLDTGEGTYALGSMAEGETRRLTFVPDRDASLELCLDASDSATCSRYGYVTRNLPRTHRLVVREDGVGYD